MARRRTPDARSLVMPAGRKIPRPASPRPKRPAPPTDSGEHDPVLRKVAGELTAGWAQIRACTACGRASDDRAYGTGHPLAPIMLLKERPSREDLESSNAFTSEAEALSKAFEALGIPLSWFYGATAVRCADAPASVEEVRACAGHLLTEIEAVSPRVIVAFGPRAAEAVIALDGRCGLSVPDDLPTGQSVRIRSDLVVLATEALPEGITQKEAKRRLWRDLRALPALVGE